MAREAGSSSRRGKRSPSATWPSPCSSGGSKWVMPFPTASGRPSRTGQWNRRPSLGPWWKPRWRTPWDRPPSRPTPALTSSTGAGSSWRPGPGTAGMGAARHQPNRLLMVPAKTERLYPARSSPSESAFWERFGPLAASKTAPSRTANARSFHSPRSPADGVSDLPTSAFADMSEWTPRRCASTGCAECGARRGLLRGQPHPCMAHEAHTPASPVRVVGGSMTDEQGEDVTIGCCWWL